MILYHCNKCLSNVLANRLQNHHAKVHPNASYDIYERVYELPAGREADERTKEWVLKHQSMMNRSSKDHLCIQIDEPNVSLLGAGSSKRSKPPPMEDCLLSGSTEEELRHVLNQHRRTLAELNLSFEIMLMPVMPAQTSAHSNE